MAIMGRLARLHAHVLRSVESVLAQHGLQVGEFDVLATLRRAGAPNEARLVRSLSPAERRTLDTLLRKLLAQFEAAPSGRG